MLPLVSAGMAEYVRGTKASSQTQDAHSTPHHCDRKVVSAFLMKCY
jgi:hypothetical protein